MMHIFKTIGVGSALLVAAGTAYGESSTPNWVASWSASPDLAGRSLKGQSVREIVRVSVGGPRVRIRLSNLFGTQPVVVGATHVALHAKGPAIAPQSDRVAHFGGKSAVTIPKGESVLSDPVDLAVPALSELAVSLFFPEDTGPSTQHGLGMQTAYLTESEDATARVSFPDVVVLSSRLFLTDVEVATASDARTIVAFGDSITDAAGSAQDANRRWPDVLAARLQATPALASIAVVNAGISGNRILHDKMGPSALARFDRDALGIAGAHWVIFLEGINDIGFSGGSNDPQDEVSAEQIIAGMKTLIARAHQRGMKVMGGTLTPFGNTDWPYHTVAGEAKRQTVNAWIRGAGAFDAVVDFDRVTRDPARPDHLLGAYDSDHIHPNDAGCKAMADAIDLTFFSRQ